MMWLHILCGPEDFCSYKLRPSCYLGKAQSASSEVVSFPSSAAGGWSVSELQDAVPFHFLAQSRRLDI